MIFIYGDSHANSNFNNITVPVINKYENSVTMFRIGRYNSIVNFHVNDLDYENIYCFSYGEVDCRCHVQRQKNLNKDEDEIIKELVCQYFKTIQNNIIKYKKIIIVAVIPQTRQQDFETLHGSILHEFPFVGTDMDRVRYTEKINKEIEKLCHNNSYIYFNPYSYYTREDGTLKFELSDTTVHLRDNRHFLDEFYKLIGSL